ncbi:hypothetical protein HYU17_02000 [Candidatus Woesearchaeota archaeon]|nr:hypothetical protein [Candidatus Woesearchaeota archaeon]
MNFGRLNKKQLLLLLLFSIITVQAVAAANVFDTSFKMLEGFDGEGFYNKHWFWLDMTAYLFLFIIISRMALQKQFEGQGSKLGIVVGAILAVALAVYESRAGWNLGSLGPFAGLFVAFIFGALIFKFASGMGAHKVPAFSFAYLGTYALLNFLANDLINTLKSLAETSENPAAGFLVLGLNIGFIIATIGLLYSIIKGVGHLFSGGFFGKQDFEKGLAEKGKDTAAAVKDHFKKTEEDVRQIGNVEQYETKLDDFAKRLGRAEIKDVQQFKESIQNAIGLAEELERVEIELEKVMAQVKGGQLNPATESKVKELREKYQQYVGKLFSRVQAADTFAKMERQALIQEVNDLIKNSQEDARILKIVGQVSLVIGSDRNRFIATHSLTGQVKKDVEMIDKEIKDFERLEQDKRNILLPAVRQLEAIADQTKQEITSLDNLLINMKALAKRGQLWRPQLNDVVTHLNSLLKMAQVQQPGIQQSQDILKRVNSLDQKLRSVLQVFDKLLRNEFQALGGGVKGRSNQALKNLAGFRI